MLGMFFCLGQLTLTETVSRRCLRVSVISGHPSLDATNLVCRIKDFNNYACGHTKSWPQGHKTGSGAL